MAVGQRGLPEGDIFIGIDISKTATFEITEAMNDIIPAPNRGIMERPFSGVIAQLHEECPSARNAYAADMTFILGLPGQCDQINGTACCFDCVRGTLSQAAGTEMVGR